MGSDEIKSVLDCFHGVLYVKDASGEIYFANRYLRELLGYDPAGGMLDSAIECFSDGCDRLSCEKVWRHGQRIFMSSESPVEWEGCTDAVAVIGYDITDRSMLEAELHAARDAAESSSAAKTRFLATMSHEIRTPLNAIMGMADILLKTDLDENQMHYAATIKDSTRLLLKIIKDILDFSKIESGKTVVDLTVFDLPESISRTAATLRAQASEKGLSLFVNIADDVPRLIRTDQDKLEQILVNLLGNAIKFTEIGFVALTARRLSPEDGILPDSSLPVYVAFQVQDTGVGIPEDKLETIFSSFTQVSQKSSRRFGGTGLGLSICRNLVHLLGGTLSVTSHEGGSCFTAVIPVETRDSEENGKEVLEQIPLDAASFEFPEPEVAGLSVLLVEDNPMNAEVIGLFLEQMGHSMVLAASGTEALRILNEQVFDLVLMDLELPDMSGNDVTVRVRSGQAGARNVDIPIVAVTAHAFVEFREECFAAGVTDYLSKPVEMETLRSCLGRVFSRAVPVPRDDRVNDDDHLLSPDTKLAALGGNEAVLHKLYSLFLRDVPNQLGNLKEFVDGADLEKVADLSHSLKGSAAIIGARKAKNIASCLERAARQGETAILSRLFSDAHVEYSLVVDLVREYLRRFDDTA